MDLMNNKKGKADDAHVRLRKQGPLSIIRDALRAWLFNGQPACSTQPGADVSQPRPLVDRTIALRLLKLQLGLAVAITLTGLLAGRWAGVSAGIGAGIALAGTLYFSLQAFRHAGATSASHIVRSFYKGEAGKFVLTAALFAVVFVTVKSVEAGWLLTGFILVHLVGAWGVLLPGTTGTKK